MQPRTLRRALALGGVAAPILFTLLVAVASLLRPGYSQFYDFISDLGVGPNAAIQNANFVVFGLLVIGLAAALQGSVPTPRSIPLIAGAMLLVLFGLGVLLAGVFPEDYAGGGLHMGVSVIAFLAIIVAEFLVGWGARKAGATWSRFGKYSLASGLAAFALFIVFGWSMGGAYQGAAQRAFLAAAFIWIGATGFQVYARNREPVAAPSTST